MLKAEFALHRVVLELHSVYLIGVGNKMWVPNTSHTS